MTLRCCIVLLVVSAVLPRSASANTESCTQAHAAGQREEHAGQLKQALANFQLCAADAECPLPIRNECTSLFTKVEARVPTVVFSVVDDRGNDVTDVRVSSADGEVANGLDGRPIAVNPGKHEFRFAFPNGEVLTKSVVVRPGEKDRVVSLTLPRSEFASPAPAVAPALAQGSAEATPSEGAPSRRLTVPVASWVSYGVGAAALISWGTFGLLGRNKEQGLVDCSPNCQADRQDDYDAMKRNYLIADISLGVAAAGIVAGTVVLLTKGRKEARAGSSVALRRRSLSVTPTAMGRASGGVLIGVRY